jgi:hypothetical protein
MSTVGFLWQGDNSDTLYSNISPPLLHQEPQYVAVEQLCNTTIPEEMAEMHIASLLIQW